MWILYDILLLVGLLLYLPSAFWRRRLPHPGWSMRLGRYPEPVRERLAGRSSIWVHAVSVGEVLAAQPLLRGLTQAYPEHPLVLSTITASGFEIASKRVHDGGVPIYFPLDLRVCVSRALQTINPRILLLMEAELWPMVIRLTQARGIPIVVVNGRMSPRAFRRYRWATPWVRRLFRHIDLFLMQSQADADRVLRLGASSQTVEVVGSLKWDASLGSRPSAEAIRETFNRLGLNGRETIVVAGSTHRGEETAVLEAFRALRASQATARLILAPRHIERLPEVETLVQRAGWRVARLSQLDRANLWDVGLVDTFGQLPLYYGIATVVFIGGSLIPHGGQNPLEATSLGKAIVFGPFMHNFESITHQLLAHHAARQLTDREELATLLQELVTNPDEARAIGQRALEVTERFQGATQRTLEAIRPLLKEPGWPQGYG